MSRLIECVPNFSEGRNADVIQKISDAISSVNGTYLLHVDSGKATNRTVFTFIGSPDAIFESAYRAIDVASRLIDMRLHHGIHSRIGATDVCPFVPISGVDLTELVERTRTFAEQIAHDFHFPVYLYGHAALKPERQNLAVIRKGQYEGLKVKLKDPVWEPDYGKPIFNAKSGASVVGVRDILIAYNVNLDTDDWKLADEIAKNIRTSGRLIRMADGQMIRQPGRLPACQAIGWYVNEYGKSQISMNLFDYRRTSMHHAFDAICEEASKHNVSVTGSEIVGMVPEVALLSAGRHYWPENSDSADQQPNSLIEMAIQKLGLQDVKPFDPAMNILEYRSAALGVEPFLIGG